MVTQFSFHSGQCDTSGNPVKVAEVFTLPSLAVPEMSLSIRDLLDRHMRGGAVKSFKPVYRDDRFPEVEKMDKLELFDLEKRTADFVATTRGRIITARKAAEIAARKVDPPSASSDNVSKQAEGSASSTS